MGIPWAYPYIYIKEDDFCCMQDLSMPSRHAVAFSHNLLGADQQSPGQDGGTSELAGAGGSGSV